MWFSWRCFVHRRHAPSSPSSHRAQACAHDRYHFGDPGTGRIAVGLYAAHLSLFLRWFERSQLLVLRCEDEEADKEHGRRTQLAKVFAHVGLDEPSEAEWSKILETHDGANFNEFHWKRPSMRPDTDKALREFYAPHNARSPFSSRSRGPATARARSAVVTRRPTTRDFPFLFLKAPAGFLTRHYTTARGASFLFLLVPRAL